MEPYEGGGLRRRSYILLLFLGICAAGHAQKRYVTAFMRNYERSSATKFQLYLVTNDSPATVRVTVDQPKFDQTVHIDSNSSTVVTLNYNFMITEQQATSKAILVSSDVDISVFGFYTHKISADAMTLLPMEYLGTEYYASTPESGQFAVANGLEEEVDVTVTVSGSISYDGSEYRSGKSFSITLSPGQVIQFQSSSDLTGTRVSSSLPVAVFSGQKCFSGVNTACDTLVEQLYPVDKWGKFFVVSPLLNHTLDSLTIVASDPDTLVNIKSDQQDKQYHLPEPGSYTQFPLEEMSIIESSKPIMVTYLVQETKPNVVSWYDPFLVNVPPSLTGGHNYKFVTQKEYYNYLLIVTKAPSADGFFLDDAPLSSYNYAVRKFSDFNAFEVLLQKIDGQHEIYHDSMPFSLYVYGIENDVSYGYSMGREAIYADFPLPSPTPDESFNPEITVIPTEGFDPETTIIPTEGHYPETTVIPTEGFNPETTVIPTEGFAPETTVIPTEGFEPETTLIPTEGHYPETTVIPSEGFNPETTVIPTEGFDPEITVIPSEGFDPEITVIPTEGFNPETTVIPTEDHYPETTVIPTEGFDLETTVIPNEGFNPEITVIPTEGEILETTANEGIDPKGTLSCFSNRADYHLPLGMVSEAKLNIFDVHLKDPRCHAVQDGNFAVIQIPFKGCGTSEEIIDGKICYENIVYGTVPGNPIHRIEIPVRCEMEMNETIGTNLHPKVTDVVSFGEYNVSLKLYQTEAFNDQVETYPFEVDIENFLHVEFKVESDDENLQLLVDNCKATPQLEDTQQIYNVIQRGCPLDSTVQLHAMEDQRLQRFSMHVFKFGDLEEVYLSCNVFICHKETSPNRCTQGCLAQRHKRDLHNSKVHLNAARLSQGPVVFKSDDLQTSHGVPSSLLMVVIGVMGSLVVLGLVIQRKYLKKKAYAHLP